MKVLQPMSYLTTGAMLGATIFVPSIVYGYATGDLEPVLVPGLLAYCALTLLGGTAAAVAQLRLWRATR